MNYFIQNRYQDGGWELTEPHDPPYRSLESAIAVASRYASDAICYGMVRVVDHNGKVYRTWAAGESCDCERCDEELASIASATYRIDIQTGGLWTFTGVALHAPVDNAESFNGVVTVVNTLAERHPNRGVRAVKNDRIVYEKLVQRDPFVLGTPRPKPARPKSLLPELSRLIGAAVGGEPFISLASLDALLVETQLANSQQQGSKDIDFLIQALREWVARADRNIRSVRPA